MTIVFLLSGLSRPPLLLILLHEFEYLQHIYFDQTHLNIFRCRVRITIANLFAKPIIAASFINRKARTVVFQERVLRQALCNPCYGGVLLRFLFVIAPKHSFWKVSVNQLNKICSSRWFEVQRQSGATILCKEFKMALHLSEGWASNSFIKPLIYH